MRNTATQSAFSQSSRITVLGGYLVLHHLTLAQLEYRTCPDLDILYNAMCQSHSDSMKLLLEVAESQHQPIPVTGSVSASPHETMPSLCQRPTAEGFIEIRAYNKA